jgi:hypothetical protein
MQRLYRQRLIVCSLDDDYSASGILRSVGPVSKSWMFKPELV